MAKKKQEVRLTVDSMYPYDLEGSIDDAIEHLQEVKEASKKHTDLRLNFVQTCDDEWEFEVIAYRLETDKECDKRIAKEKERKEREAEHRRQEFQKLKKEFENE